MLDFSEKIYEKIFNFQIARHLEMAYFEYPFLFSIYKKRDYFRQIVPKIQNNFNIKKYPFGLYVHIPFCRSRCRYCRYYSQSVGDGGIIDDYLDAIDKQLAITGLDLKKIDLRNVYIGGGTPTILNNHQLEKLFGTINKFISDDKKIQITIEANPETLDRDKVNLLKKLGVSRISIGVQSFNDGILKLVGRRALSKAIFRAADLIKGAGLCLAIDLIIGLPGENKKTYSKTLKETLKLEPDFIEEFVFVPTSSFYISRITPINFSLDKAIKMFDEKLSQKFRIYAKGNSRYWIKKGAWTKRALNQNLLWSIGLGQPFLGLGPTAISFLPDIKFASKPNIKGYIDYFKYGKSANNFYFRTISFDRDDLKRHFIITHIASGRLFYKKTYFHLFGSSLKEDFPREFETLKKEGILVETPKKFIWRLDDKEMGQKPVLMHALKYWYHRKHIRNFLKALKKMPIP